MKMICVLVDWGGTRNALPRFNFLLHSHAEFGKNLPNNGLDRLVHPSEVAPPHLEILDPPMRSHLTRNKEKRLEKA